MLMNGLSHRKLKIEIATGQLYYMEYLLLFEPNIDLVNYADDSTPSAMGGNSELEVINEIKSVVESLN